ncbi:MAG: methyltransferase, partial [Acidimicrobiales bacterium]
MARLLVPQGDFELERFPVRAKDLLRPWDAADEYLLSAIAGDSEIDFISPDLRGRTVIVNDAFGALATALSVHSPISVSDSELSIEAARRNVTKNRAGDPVEFRSSVEPLPFPIDVVILKVPKTLGLLEQQLHEIRESSHLDTAIVAGGMARHIHTSTLDLFDQVIGPTVTSLARKKARLIFPKLDLERDVAPSSWPKSFEALPGLKVVSYAGVFSSDKLDQGTRVMLDNLPSNEGLADVVDLGCGNGVLGTAIAAQGDLSVAFV